MDFAGALRELELNLESVETNLLFLESASWLRSRIGGLLNWSTLDAESIRKSTQFMEQRDVPLETASRALFILVAGAFEQFIRRVLRDTVVQLNQRSSKFEILDAALILQNRLRTGHALATIAEPPDHIELDYNALCENVGTCITGGERVVLNAEAFAYFVFTLTPTKLEQIFRRIGFDLNWDEVGRDSTIQEIFGTTNPRSTGTAAKDKLKDVAKNRNAAAHTGSTGIVIDFTSVRGASEFLLALGNVIARLIIARHSALNSERS